MVHEFAGWADELRSLQMPTLLVFGGRDFSWLPPVAQMSGLLPDVQLAVLTGAMHVGASLRPGEAFALITRPSSTSGERRSCARCQILGRPNMRA